MPAMSTFTHYKTLTTVRTFDLSSRRTYDVVSTVAALLTSTIMWTVGSVVEMFCACGGRTVTGTTPARDRHNVSQVVSWTVNSNNIQQSQLLQCHLNPTASFLHADRAIFYSVRLQFSAHLKVIHYKTLTLQYSNTYINKITQLCLTADNWISCTLKRLTNYYTSLSLLTRDYVNKLPRTAEIRECCFIGHILLQTLNVETTQN